MIDREIYTAVVLEDAALTIDDVALACSVSAEWVVSHVEEGAIPCLGNNPDDWRFGSRELARARRIRALERDFDAVPELAALVADMLDEIDALRGRLRKAGLA